MATAASFAALQRELFPRWCKRPRTASLLSALSAQKDEVVARLSAAVTLRLASLCPDDALGLLGQTLGLERSPLDTNASFRTYLKGAWEAHRLAGTELQLSRELERLWVGAEIFTWRRLSDNAISGFGGDRSCFFVRIAPGNGFVLPWKWDAVGADWDDAGRVWDLGVVSEALRKRLEITRRWIHRWRPAGMTCRYIEVVFTVDGFGQPLKYTRIPVRERWELGADGVAVHSYYNGGY